MNKDGDQDVFEITDFTTASDWERFIARIEELIHEWSLTGQRNLHPLAKGDLVNEEWGFKKEEIFFASYSFELIYHFLKPKNDAPSESSPQQYSWALKDMMSFENDFPHKAHCLVRWYGLREFAILCPAISNECITTEDRAKLLLSSICIALNNTNCQVPVFVQVQQPPHQFYLGIGECPGIRTHFDMVYLPKSPAGLNHLSGLLSVFKSKLGWPSHQLPPTLLSIRITYILQEWPMFALPKHSLEIDISKSMTTPSLAALPFGPLEEPIKELHLYVTWPKVDEDCVHDNDIISNLEPIKAPQWALKIRSSDTIACCLGDFLRDFYKLCQRFDSNTPLLTSPLHLEDEDIGSGALNEPLERLAQPSLSSLLLPASQASLHKKSAYSMNQLPEDVLLSILQFIFPDSAPIPPEREDSDDIWQDSTDLMYPKHEIKLLERLRPLKSAPVGSLTWRLVLALGHTNVKCGGMKAVAHLWQEFLQELRHRWENNLILPGLDPGHPNLTTCLIHQKLQLLNCCIERKKSREWQQLKSFPGTSTLLESDDEEFYECEDESSDQRKSVLNEGILKRLGNLTLWEKDTPLYIPVTQEPAPMTEDMLEKHAEVLLQLGTNPEGAALRARLQSASLLADMEAFKAANPEGGLHDFVRWYSPRDWIESDTLDPETKELHKHGELSARMQIPGNMWQEAWETAKPTPAHRQKRLFDDTREAEKVLHFLASLTPSQLVHYLMPVLFHASLLSLADKAEEGPRDLGERWEQAAILASRASMTGKSSLHQEVVSLLATCEARIVQAQTLYQRLSLPTMSSAEKQSIWDFILNLLEHHEAEVPNAAQGLIGGRLRQLFLQAQKESQMILDEDATLPSSNLPEHMQPTLNTSSIREFPPPAGREMILRTVAPFPNAASSPIPHRMHCVLTPACFRLAAAFSQDTTYY